MPPQDSVLEADFHDIDLVTNLSGDDFILLPSHFQEFVHAKRVRRAEDDPVYVRSFFDREWREVEGGWIGQQPVVILQHLSMNVVIVIRARDLLLDRGVMTKTVERRRGQEEQKVACWRSDEFTKNGISDLVNSELVDENKLGCVLILKKALEASNALVNLQGSQFRVISGS